MDNTPDFYLDGKSSEEIAEELAHSLQLKGYCLLDFGARDSLDDIFEEVVDLQTQERFQPPPPQVAEGLLGVEGSAELAWLPFPYDEAYSDGETLRTLCKDLSYTAGCTRVFYERLGLENMRISQPLLLRGGDTDLDEPELTEDSCSFWLNLFLSSVPLLFLYFMGPDEGTLEMQPLDEEADAYTITTKPDMLVILRGDVLTHNHTASSDNYVLCSWVTTPAMTGPRGWHTAAKEAGKIPGVAQCSEWMENRLKVLLQLQLLDQLPDDIPREWQRMMRATNLRDSNLPAAVVGHAMHGAGSWDWETFWKTCTVGVDYLEPIRFTRWNHEWFYDPDPESYQQSHVCTGGVCKTAMKHMQFMDGAEGFDNKFFQISQSEAGGMDCQQRHILETSYEGLYMAGFKKKELMNNYIAVFSGVTQSEAAYIQYPSGAGAGNISPAIISNRTSFVLGLMGPSTAIDADLASSSMALIVGAAAVCPNNEWRTNSGGNSNASVSGGVYMCLTPFMWPRWGAFMNPIGRCITFDQSANGYVIGELSGTAILKPYTERVDGEWVKSKDACYGSMVSWRMSRSGQAASLTAPHAQSYQECVYQALREAAIDPLDLDAVECHGIGNLMDDSVEVFAISRVLRSMEGSGDIPLNLGAVKSNVGCQREACNMVSFCKVMYNILFACTAPSLHLKVLNPHAELGKGDFFFGTESTPYQDRTPFHGVSARGWGGTAAHIIEWNAVDTAKVRTTRLEPLSEVFAYWPGGGGMLEKGALPASSYQIIGSWGQWTDPAPMQMMKDGCFVHTVKLGPNQFETFQIWLDGDSSRVLHPGMPKAPSGCAVHGPADLGEAEGMNWMIDGRVARIPVDAASPQLALGEGDAAEGAQEVVEYSTRDKGSIGDEYEVKLLVSGKYRAVTWSKVASVEEPTGEILDEGTYYLTGSFNDWDLSEMALGANGNHTYELGPHMTDRQYEFQIIRNRDWDQRFHPPFGTTRSWEWDEYEVDGPDDEGHGKNWCIAARRGDRIKVEFQRILKLGHDIKHIAWHPVRRIE